MNYYSYLVEHDYGLAPNPFGRYCTLAVCKPKIRRSGMLRIGDWIIGTGSKALEETSGKKLRGRLIYGMQVSEIIRMEDYWTDIRFAYKKPVVNGPLATMYGDNIYHKNENGKWIQENSAHSGDDGTVNLKHLETDTSGVNVLVAEHFFYFGQNAPIIPKSFTEVCHTGIGEKKLDEKTGSDFVHWINKNYSSGIHGDPVNWIQYIQGRLL